MSPCNCFSKCECFNNCYESHGESSDVQFYLDAIIIIAHVLIRANKKWGWGGVGAKSDVPDNCQNSHL